MKKIILVALMAVMIATPCFAQEVEPEGIFSIEGTRWQSLPTGVQILPSPSLVPIDWGFGFYGGEAYGYDTYFCIDMIVCSIFYVGIHPGSGGGVLPSYFGILQPIGIGIVVEIYGPYYKTPIELTVGILIKTNDNWKPPEFVSVSPNKGEQGTTLTDVTVIGANTYFESGVDVFFSSFDSGMSISNIRTISNTEIKFDLAIETDAPIGFKSIVILYNDGNESIFGHDVFEVLPKTN